MHSYSLAFTQHGPVRAWNARVDNATVDKAAQVCRHGTYIMQCQTEGRTSQQSNCKF